MYTILSNLNFFSKVFFIYFAFIYATITLKHINKYYFLYYNISINIIDGGGMLLYSTPDADPKKYHSNKKLENIGLITMGPGMLCALTVAATAKKNQSR